MSKNKNSKQEYKFWFLVVGVTLIIFVGWVVSLRYNLSKNEGTQFAWPDLSLNQEGGWSKFGDSLNMLGNILADEELAPQEELAEESPRRIISNPNNLTDEEIETLEKELFPEKKDAQENKE